MKCLDRGKFHVVICFFLNTGLWVVFSSYLKKGGEAQKCLCEEEKRQKLSNSFPWRDMRKKTGSSVEKIHFLTIGLLAFCYWSTNVIFTF